MNKVEVYIDFEAITNPFASIIKVPNDTPFAYSIGLLNKQNLFQSSTFIVDFGRHSNKNSILEIIKKSIEKDIKRINPNVTMEDVVFVGHNPVLERKILLKIFPDNEVIALLPKIRGQDISLSKLAYKKFSNKKFFVTLKEEISKNEGLTFIKNQVIAKDGMAANYAGYLLFLNSAKGNKQTDKRYKLFIPISTRILINEIRNYSRDDVLKMCYVINIENLEHEMKKIQLKDRLINLIKILDINKDLKVSELIEKIWEM
ncbi:hypothetical protein JN00_0417 [Metamycoplasma subdolum]|uniref:DUF2779 domain-containing protein n=1 Tax=Metamycoplasma subdolum TaxID=92407 RepID=A0A3L9ZYP6_9BACT|nr:DUF2779 domain-containing protein [Metamycoplasma subdolum]RMA77566.1 hypothetical protein JN00_0417 [Metamycoplasma subdolum]WPB50360.1 DUF2779 domain-containing protein [Metamycoplasma subdolum]